MPFRGKKPEEILTQANHLLGKGQTSLTKFLIIASGNDHPQLTTHDYAQFFQHVLERIDLGRDLHFQTKTTIDTLDYSGSGWNEGSKVIIACCGEKRRELRAELPPDFDLPEGFSDPRFVMPGVLAVQAPVFSDEKNQTDVATLAEGLKKYAAYFEKHVPLILLVDDSKFTTATLSNFLWVAFTRANPSHDLHGIDSYFENKHWCCRGALLMDARKKPHHAPELIPDANVKSKVEQMLAEW
jgi:4-hydroxy-3-polyprenylbenzoate decarboxylase